MERQDPDACAWYRMCTSFGDASASLCDSLSFVAHRLSTVTIDSAILMPFVACRLIPLDKRPGVRLIGIGDVPRRIIAKAILFSVGDDVISAAGPLQTCAGHAAGSEAAIHAMQEIFCTADCEAALLVDASNAFNSINRKAVLHNIAILCPALSTVLHNTYSATVHLFVTGEGEISSTKGTTQGDPLAMAMYALAVVPLIGQLRAHVPEPVRLGLLMMLLQWALFFPCSSGGDTYLLLDQILATFPMPLNCFDSKT